MEQILELFKNYFGIAFVFLIISYLAPKESYRRYFQFIISIMLAIILFQPLEEWMFSKRSGREALDWEQVKEAFNASEYSRRMEEDIFEWFGEQESSGLEESSEQRKETKTR